MLIPVLLLACAGCGKKGPPLAPFVRIPAAVETIDARRVGDDVYVTLTVPARNIDASAPADVQRVEVYAYTGAAAPARGRFLDAAALVETVAVAPVPRAGGAAPAAGADVAQGVPVTIRDALSGAELTAQPAVVARTGAAAPPAEAATEGPPRRFYMAIAFSERGVPGPQGTVTDVPLTRLPDPPSSLEGSYTADAVTLAWQPPGGLIAFLLDRALPFEPPPPGVDAAPAPPQPAAPAAPVLYNVYRAVAPDPLALPAAPGEATPRAAAPVPVNAMPLAALAYTDPIALDERERCYTVRTVRAVEDGTIEGDASPPVCVSPVDVFPPAPPAELAAIASANAISLIWEPSLEPDLAGYVVLRGAPGGDTLDPLTRAPIADAQYTDETVAPGARYVYHVIAVDSRLPLPNASAPAIIEATAR